MATYTVENINPRPDTGASPFPDADAEFWRASCLIAWQRALDLWDECERLKAELAGAA